MNLHNFDFSVMKKWLARIKGRLMRISSIIIGGICIVPAVMAALSFAADNDMALITCQYDDERQEMDKGEKEDEKI